MLEWSVRIRCNEFELGGSFSVLIFVGTVPDDPKQWLTSPSCVGIHDVYAGSAPHDSDSRGDCEVEGYVRLKGGLLEQLGASELTPDVVVPYLKSELHWRVLNVSFTLMCVKNILPDT
jgi:tyrosinase